MKHSDFAIGKEFQCGDGTWLTTDIGTRVIVAIRVDEVELVRFKDEIETTFNLSRSEAEEEGWFKGPPYAVAESIFDENDIPACTVVEKKDGDK